MTALEALDRVPPPFEFNFDARAFRFRPPGQFVIAFEVPISNLTAVKDGNARRVHAHLLALVKNEEGNIVARVSRDVSSAVGDKTLLGLQTDTMIYEHAVTLPAGRFTVQTAVMDQEGQHASATEFRLENRPDALLSDVALVARIYPLDRAPDASDPFEIPGKRAQPFVNTSLPAGARPYIYFVAYPEPGAEPQLEVQFIRNGQVAETQHPALPKPDESGAVPMAIQPAASPGEFEVRVVLKQGDKSAERSLKYTVAAK
jgi:hypothetical protein